MAKSLQFANSVASRLISGSSSKLLTVPRQLLVISNKTGGNGNITSLSSRAHSSVSSMAMATSSFTRSFSHSKPCRCLVCTGHNTRSYSTEVEKELSQFLDKEIQFENSRSSEKLPKILGFEVTTDGGNVTLTKTSSGEKIVVKLSVNGEVDSFDSLNAAENEEEPPQMVCRPPFHVEITKDRTVLALQCAYPPPYSNNDEEAPFAKERSEVEENEDQFQVQEVTIHEGEWTDSTYSVSSESMDPELFDLLMDMLNERGINDKFSAQLIDFCTVYENKQYINFLQNLKNFADK